MVSIEIQRNSDGQVIGCHLSGHAGYDEHGFDIVCAAVSALSATAMLGLTQIAQQEGEYTNSEGQCDIVLSGTINQSGQDILGICFSVWRKLAVNIQSLSKFTKYRR